MEEMKRDGTRRSYALIGVLGVTVLALLMLVSTAGAAPFAYITNTVSDTVSVIDTATNTVTTTLNVGSGPYGVASNLAGTNVYVANSLSNNVSVIDIATNTVTTSVNVARAYGVAVNPVGTKVYVTSPEIDTVSVIDTATNTVTATVNVESGPLGVAVSPDGTKAYVTNYKSNTVSIINTTSNTVINTVAVGNQPWGVAVTPDGTKVYIANHWDTTVSVIDTATNTVTTAVKTGTVPYGVAVTPDGTKAYVTNWGDGLVSVIDTATNTVTDTVVVGNSPAGVAVSPDGTKVFVANWGYGQVSVIDTATNTVTDTVPVESGPYAFGQFIGGQKATPTITWNNPADITSGTALGSEQLNAIATAPHTGSSVTGTFTYNPEEGTVLDVGTHTLHVDFVPTDTATYNNASADVQINVLPVTLKNPTIIWDNPANITVGTGLGSTQLNAVAKDPVTGAIVEGTYLYDPAAGIQLPVGNGQKLHVNFMPTDTATYNTATADVTINVLEKLVAPVANFFAIPTTGKAPLTVTFTDKSTGSPTSWSWNFGDKSTSIDQSPVHTYSKAGKYTVSLTVKNELGSNIRKISNYIVVKK